MSSSALTARLSRRILSRFFERKPPRKSSKSRYGRGVCVSSVEADALAAGGALLCQYRARSTSNCVGGPGTLSAAQDEGAVQGTAVLRKIRARCTPAPGRRSKEPRSSGRENPGTV
eukprot:scaffold54876_cov75-Phaeocystis_antarctica.AAC.2